MFRAKRIEGVALAGTDQDEPLARQAFRRGNIEGLTLGAGEPTGTTIPAVIGNAIYDATGARLRSVPFTPERVRTAVAATRKST